MNNYSSQNLKYIRDIMKLSAEAFAEMFGAANRQQVYNYERPSGTTRPPEDVMVRVSKFTGLSLDDLTLKDIKMMGYAPSLSQITTSKGAAFHQEEQPVRSLRPITPEEKLKRKQQLLGVEEPSVSYGDQLDRIESKIQLLIDYLGLVPE